MAGKPRKPRKPKPSPADEDEDSFGEPASGDILELQVELRAAEVRLRELRALPGNGYSHLRDIHLADARVWSLRSEIRFAEKNDDGARKASTTAAEHSALAAKLEKESLSDRVTALEAQVRRARGLGHRLAELEEED